MKESEKETNRARSEKVKKAAMLLLSIGREEASKILSQLDDKMIEEVVLEMSRIRSISKQEKEEVLLEFRQNILDLSDSDSPGGLDAAKEILDKSIGKEKAENIIRKLEKKDVDQDFAFLNEIDASTLSQLLATEAPQTIAVTLAFLEPKKAADAMKQFPLDLQAKVAHKLANTTKTHPDAVKEIAKVLKKKFEQRDRSEYSEAGGTEALASILNHMDKSLEEHILKDLQETSPELASQVREKLYTFEDIQNLDHREMRTLISKISDDSIIGTALRGAENTIKMQFFNSMSQNRASDIIDAMEMRGKLTIKEINEARSQILTIVRDLEEEGIILLKKDKEEYI